MSLRIVLSAAAVCGAVVVPAGCSSAGVARLGRSTARSSSAVGSLQASAPESSVSSGDSAAVSPSAPPITPSAPSVSAAPPVATTSAVQVYGDCQHLQRRPDTIRLSCADSGEYLVSLRWTSWGAESATGTGSWSINQCTPDCADGVFRTYSGVTVRLSRPVAVAGVGQVWTVLTPSSWPPGFLRTPYSLPLQPY